MGDISDMVLAGIAATESLRDDYTHGYMSDEDAFEHGFINSMGMEEEGMQTSWDRHPIHTGETLDKEIVELMTVLDLMGRE